MFVTRFYVGTSSYPDAPARAVQAMTAIAALVGGVTVHNGTGAWISPAGALVTEPCAVFVVGALTDFTDRILGRLFETYPNEQSIAVENQSNLIIKERPV